MKRSVFFAISMMILVVISLTGYQTGLVESAVTYLQKNTRDSTSATSLDYVLLVQNQGNHPTDRGAAVKAFNMGTGSSPGYAFGQFGGTFANSNAAGFNGWAASNGIGNAIGVKGTADTIGGTGVYGSATQYSNRSDGIYGVTNSYQGYGVNGYNNSGGTNPSIYGVYGMSLNYGGVRGVGAVRGVYGSVSSANGNGFYTPDSLFVGRGCTGCFNNSIIAQNSSGQTLIAGQFVSLQGVGNSEAESTNQGLLAIDILQPSNEHMVIGVIQSLAKVERVTYPNPACEAVSKQLAPMATPQAPHQNANLAQEQQRYNELVAQCEKTPTYQEEEVYILDDTNIEAGQMAVVATSGIAHVKLDQPLQQGQAIKIVSTHIVAAEKDDAHILGHVAGEPNPETGLTPVLLRLGH